MDADNWDDSTLLKIFHETISSHTTKNIPYTRMKKSRKRKMNTDSAVLPIGEPGAWAPVEVEPTDSYDNIAHVSSSSDLATSLRLQMSSHPVGDVALEEALQSVMHSWYQAGYASGRYDALREMRGAQPQDKELAKAHEKT